MTLDMPLRSHGIWPSRSEEMVIRAAMADPLDAPGLWREWLADNDIDRLSFATFRLLPLLYTKLSTADYDGPEMGKLRGTYRQSWYRNQLLMRSVSGVLQRFNDRNIESLLIKGIPLSLRTYQDPGARSMGDGDIMVHREDRFRAIELLEELGWVRKNQFLPGHAVAYQLGDGMEIDLHWYVTKYHQFGEATQPFWSGSVPFELDSIPTRALNHTDELLHCLIHGVHWEQDLPIRWVPDALHVMARHEDEIDWNRLLAVAKQMRSGPTSLEALKYLKNSFDAPVPLDVLDEMENTDWPIAHRIELWFRLRATARYPWGSIPLQWISYWRTERDMDRVPTPWGFASAVKTKWGAESWRHFAAEVMMRIRRRARWLIDVRLRRKLGNQDGV